MSGERFTLDTNILVYSVDNAEGRRRDLAKQVIDLASYRDCRLTLQAVAEFYWVVTRKDRMPAASAAALVHSWLEVFPSIPHSRTAIQKAMTLASEGRASYWDAMLIATAAEGSCTVIVTEDLSDGATTGGLRVVNPFGQHGLSATVSSLLQLPG